MNDSEHLCCPMLSFSPMWDRPWRCPHSHFIRRETEAEWMDFSGLLRGTQLAGCAWMLQMSKSLCAEKTLWSKWRQNYYFFPCTPILPSRKHFCLPLLVPLSTLDACHHFLAPASDLKPGFQIGQGHPASWGQGRSALQACHSELTAAGWVIQGHVCVPCTTHARSLFPCSPDLQLVVALQVRVVGIEARFRCLWARTEGKNFYYLSLGARQSQFTCWGDVAGREGIRVISFTDFLSGKTTPKFFLRLLLLLFFFVN